MVPAESPASDESLVEAALAGDDEAFSELARRHKSRVFGLASRFTRNAADLEDICQEVFVQAFFKLRQFRGDSPFQHWVLRIATYKCYDYLRRSRRSPPAISIDALLASGHEPSALENPAPDPDLEKLHAALAELSPKERLVITLLEIEDHSLKEVVDLTGWTLANVKVRAFRARNTLRKLIEKMK